MQALLETERGRGWILPSRFQKECNPADILILASETPMLDFSHRPNGRMAQRVVTSQGLCGNLSEQPSAPNRSCK